MELYTVTLLQFTVMNTDKIASEHTGFLMSNQMLFAGNESRTVRTASASVALGVPFIVQPGKIFFKIVEELLPELLKPQTKT